MLILVPLDMYFDAVVVFVTSLTLSFRLALAILCSAFVLSEDINWIRSKIPHRISKLGKAYSFRFQSCEIPVTEDQKGYEIVDLVEDAVTVFTAKEPWAAGMFCRSIWPEVFFCIFFLIKNK